MKGTLKKVNNQWLVYYQESIMSNVLRNIELPLYPKDCDNLNEFEDKFGDGSLVFDGLVIEFEIIDEFTHQQLYEGLDWGIGKFAKLL